MSTLSSEKKPLVDYGVQIRFIKDLHDTGGGYPEKTRGGNAATPPSNKYGVAVRVQGISGQPYVVLKDGEKGDSYGVQLKTNAQHPASRSGSVSPHTSQTKSQEADVTNPYSPVCNKSNSPISPPDYEDGEIFGSPLRRPPGDGQAGSQGEAEGGAGTEAQVERTKIESQPKATANGMQKIAREWDSSEEFNEAGLKPVKLRVGRKVVERNGISFTGSLGRHSGKKLNLNALSASFPEPPPPVSIEEVPVSVDTNSLAPINKLISKFNSSPTGSTTQARGRSGARQRLRFDERRRSRSLDARKDHLAEVSPPSPSSPTPNPYAIPLSPLSTPYDFSTPFAPGSGSLRKSPASVATVTALAAPKPGVTSLGRFVAKDTPPAIPKKPDIPTPLRDQSHKVEVISSEEEQAKQVIYNILKEGTGESDSSIKRKVNLVYEKTSRIKKAGTDGGIKKELGEKLPENIHLQKQLNRCKTELQKAQNELAEVRMAREGAESRLRQQEDQLAELQEELRRVSENSPHTDSLQMDVVTLQADLAEVAMLRQRQEETLHQRERELTALKGVLKEEVESHDREIEALREQYSHDMENLRRTMEQVTESQEQIEEERQRVNSSMLTLEGELDSCREQEDQWKVQLEAMTQDLQSTKEENKKHSGSQTLLKSRLEKEEFEGELKDLQDSLMAMKKQLPGLEDEHSYAEDLRRCHDDLKRARADLDKQRGEFDRRSEELQALKRASEKREAELRSEIDRLKDQSQRDKAELEKAKESLVESSTRTPVDQGTNQELQEANARLRERLSRMTRLHSSMPLSSGTEKAIEALEDENRSLKSQLEEAKRGVARLSKERDELNRRLEERDVEREALRRGKSDLEEQKRLLDRALEKINKEMELMMGDSHQSVAALQTQLDEYRERSRKDLLDAQRNNKDRLAELQRAQGNLKAQQEEVSRLKKELLVCGEERDSAQLERDLLSSRLKRLESELETEKSSHTDRAREIRGLEDKIKALEIELDEERSGVELLNDRITRSREQIDQLRSDLMQERSARHDLEMDKSALERQVKELKSRVADMEGQTRPTAGITLLENKVQELEERLRSEEREKASIQASQRRMERKLKELNATLDQERNQHAEQRDQLSLRVKALKRQVDESEGEVERLEGVRRKVLRDLEEQQELQEALQAKVSALEAELKRKVQQTRRPALGSSNFSSEEDDGLFDTGSISDILNESHLQTTNC
ncbi:cingulin [Lampris incognitus]|uniref:cingulin n=1 Tax=Lampris incognitus TaxID=2546036 RepID=UPI0024B60431|nr:cingulin [Lampris incognitus]